MALLGVWYNNFFGAQTRRGAALRAVPQALPGLPAAARRWRATASTSTLDGSRVDYQTGPIYWGEPGTNGQHSFYQLIHQGTRLDPVRLHRASADSLNPLGRHHDLLMANVFAQTEALAFGKTAEEVKAEGTPDWLVPHRTFEGNRPSNTISCRHARRPQRSASWSRSTSTASSRRASIWNIDSFDQWGVELGKVLAQRIIPELESKTERSSPTTVRRTT